LIVWPATSSAASASPHTTGTATSSIGFRAWFSRLSRGAAPEIEDPVVIWHGFGAPEDMAAFYIALSRYFDSFPRPPEKLIDVS
jgi:hypothetical protein